LQFTVNARVCDGHLEFSSCETLLRYRRRPDQEDAITPAVLDCEQPDTVWADSPFTLEEVGRSGLDSFLKLAFDGDAMNDLIEDAHPLYLGFLDQANFELELDMGFVALLEGEDPCEGNGYRLTESLILKLAVQTVPLDDED
jgi:hypothetical protein